MGAWIHPCSTWILADTPWIFLKLGMIMHRSKWQTGVTEHMGNGAHIWHLFFDNLTFSHITYATSARHRAICGVHQKDSILGLKNTVTIKKIRSVQMGLKNTKKTRTPFAVISRVVPHPWLGVPCPGVPLPCPGLGYPVGQDWGTPQSRTWVPVVSTGVPVTKGPRTSHWGTPRKGYGTSGSIMGSRWGTPPGVNWQTEILPSPFVGCEW